jgi:hypothetical protein
MKAQPSSNHSFSEDVEFLSSHIDPVLLEAEDGAARVLIAPEYQGRVMTSSAAGGKGTSFGWINYDLIESGEKRDHIHVFGGEDRFWMGPEGGQYAIFFEPDTPFDFEHWQTPPVIDTDAYEVVARSAGAVSFKHQSVVRNWTGFEFTVGIHRKVELLKRTHVEKVLGISLQDDIPMVAYQSVNQLVNQGLQPWRPETGLLSIWILGMYKPSDATTILVPIQAGNESELGPRVNAAYFGPVPADRLVVEEEMLYYLGDGRQRGKIGVSPARACEVCGSYDPIQNALTVVQYTLPVGDNRYVNSMWEMQDDPYSGDVVNSYNDGPPEPGAPPLGPFYELETSSPALALSPGESGMHMHRTFHFQGTEQQLDPIARSVFGVGIEKISSVFQ